MILTALFLSAPTCPIVVFLVVLHVRGLRGQSGAQAVLFVDAEKHWSSFQHQVLQPVGHGGLQVLLVDQTHNQHRFCQADYQEGHADHEVHTCRTGKMRGSSA